ncbi:MAG TPA: helix-turn-helix domain-containing protein [Niastella sp.]|nr:helix-turn-helix domain-containing protein [Niastella sp.]
MYQTVLPAPGLRNYVSCFWEGELTVGNGQAHTYHAVATSKVEWLFCYAGNYSTNNVYGQQVQVPAACFYGQANTCKKYISTAEANGIFGVRLYAHAIPLLFNIPATELTNQYVDISSLLNNRGCELADEIFKADTFEERVAIISAFLQTQIQHSLSALTRFEVFITTINQTGMSVSELAGHVHLSQRQFERHFKYLTGFSAKAFFKISRFENLIEALGCPAGTTPKNLTNLALEHGYYDQSHLNRHFKEFTGMAPGKFLQLKS